MTLGDIIKQYRTEEHMSMDEFSKKAGISKQYISILERNYNPSSKKPPVPTMDTIISVSSAIGLEFDHVLSMLDKNQKVRLEVKVEEEKPSSYSDGALKLADAYDNDLDNWGRQAVRELVETEVERCRDEAQLRESPLKEEPKVIPLFWSPAAAGLVSPILGQEYDTYELKPEDPQGAMFAVKVDGDSMEPYFPDGSIAFCNKDPITDGEVGVFCLDGESFIKQYLYDPVLRMTYLFSLNRKRSDADKLITSTSGQTLTCMGRVMTRRRPPLPGK